MMEQVKYIVLDVDGTMTDGSVYYDSLGNEFKRFNIKDGLIIKSASEIGMTFVVLTGRKSVIVEKRMNELDVSYVFQGITDKKVFLQKFFSDINIPLEHVAYIGDDLNDMAAMDICGFVACPQDAATEIKEIADYIAKNCGGQGAVREIVEYILKEQNMWEYIVEKYK